MASSFPRGWVGGYSLPKERSLWHRPPRAVVPFLHGPSSCSGPALLSPAKIPAPAPPHLAPPQPVTSCIIQYPPRPRLLPLDILTSPLPFFLGQSRKQRWPTAQELVSQVCGCHRTTRTSPSTLLSRAGKTGNKVTIQRSRWDRISPLPQPCALSCPCASYPCSGA